MRLVFPILFAFMLWVIGSSWVKMVVGADPKEEAVSFVHAVQDGGLAKTVKHFGSNVCRCPHKGGWGAYLIYISGQEPNLAFLLGHPFEIGKPSLFHMLNDVQTILPWQKPEDTSIDVPITFDANRYRPYFLPLPMAYGQKMTESEFNEFLKSPDVDTWKGFTLRLRPNLKSGAVAPPAEPLPLAVESEFEALDKHAAAKRKAAAEDGGMQDAVESTLGPKAALYLTPRDAGPVLDAAGVPIRPDKVEAMLPRLEKVVLRLHVVRRSKVSEWTIYHFGLIYPVLKFPDGHEVELRTYLRPGGDAGKKAAQELIERGQAQDQVIQDQEKSEQHFDQEQLPTQSPLQQPEPARR